MGEAKNTGNKTRITRGCRKLLVLDPCVGYCSSSRLCGLETKDLSTCFRDVDTGAYSFCKPCDMFPFMDRFPFIDRYQYLSQVCTDPLKSIKVSSTRKDLKEILDNKIHKVPKPVVGGHFCWM